jgi:hypothetical protein
MADEHKTPGEFPDDRLDTPGDSGLGNLPPLSDFDSGGMDSDGGLPPLGNFDSGGSPSDSAGLPPISDIQVETPQPTGGNVRRPPAGFDSRVNDTFSSGTPGIDTPAGVTPSSGLSPVGSGFQDLAADSDFSPETPEIGPGPDSNMDTPMFDSAFGGGSGSGFGVDTGAPTQAMETPMFGRPAQQRGFDAGAFGGSGGDFGMGGGTPAPDFSPDTDMRAPMGRGFQPASESLGGGGRGGGGGGSPLALVIAAVIALIIGVVAGPFASGVLTFLPNPMRAELDTAKADVQRLQTDNQAKQRQIDELMPLKGAEGGLEMSPEKLEELRNGIIEAQKQFEEKQAALTDVSGKLEKTEGDLDMATEQFVARSEELEDMQNTLSITQAQQRGLAIEVERLTNQVGQLDEADQRRAATKQALEHAIDRLYIQVKEGMPLTPAKYDRNERIRKVEELRDQVGGAKWVTPALQEAFNELYLTELAIAQSQEYFYSKIPVIDAYGSRVLKWAECLMHGNNEVLYRSFDGKNIGIFKNMAEGDDPAWGFDENLPPAALKEIEARVMNSRVEGFEEKVQALAERELSLEGDTAFQRAFSSL